MDYSTIKSLALSFADRTDTEVIDQMDNFLQLVEAKVNRAFKTRKQSVRTRVPCVDEQEYYGLPSDYSGMRSMSVIDPADESDRRTLKFRTPEQITDKAGETIGAYQEHYYTIVADQIQLMPPQSSDMSIEMVYYQRLVPLSVANTTNWVSDNHPDAYIHGLVTEISKFVKDKDAAQLWATALNGSLAEIVGEDIDERWAGTPMEMTANG